MRQYYKKEKITISTKLVTLNIFSLKCTPINWSELFMKGLIIMKKLLVFDMDNVCCDLQGVWLDLYNQKYNENVKKEHIRSYDIHNYVNAGYAIYELIDNTDVFRRLPPLPGAIEGLKYLISQGHKVQICSAATDNQIEGKLDWLQFYVPEIKKQDIFFTQDKSIMMADFMFDDALHNLYNSSCKIPVVFTQPWNLENNDFVRINNWIDIVKLVEST
jgi:5'(3')-deoxyribonucleotidase